MFLFSPTFDWSFCHLPRFNWGYSTLPKCSYFTQMFLILPKTLLKFFSWPKFHDGCWNYHDSSSLKDSVYFAIRGKKEWPLFWPLFCPWFGYYFGSVWGIDTTSLHVNVAVYFAQILKMFARIMANFSALGMRPQPLHPNAVRLCLLILNIWRILNQFLVVWGEKNWERCR